MVARGRDGSCVVTGGGVWSSGMCCVTCSENEGEIGGDEVMTCGTSGKNEENRGLAESAVWGRLFRERCAPDDLGVLDKA